MTEGRRILVVEDEEIILADLTRTLRKQGYEIAGTASSGPAAIRTAESVGPDLVLMDVRLRGGMNGIEAAHAIRQRSNAPILFVTAHADALTLKSKELPANSASVAKPFSPTQLRAAIETMLRTQ